MPALSKYVYIHADTLKGLEKNISDKIKKYKNYEIYGDLKVVLTKKNQINVHTTNYANHLFIQAMVLKTPDK